MKELLERCIKMILTDEGNLINFTLLYSSISIYKDVYKKGNLVGTLYSGLLGSYYPSS